jgi:hypothetical protein
MQISISKNSNSHRNRQLLLETMIVTSEAKNYAALGILTINTVSLTLAIYCLIKYVRAARSFHQPLPHKFYFKKTAVVLVALFHVLTIAIVAADLVMAWAINTNKRVGQTIIMAMNVTEVTIIEIILVCMAGYFLNILPGFMQGGLGYTTSFILQHGPRLSLFIFSICIVVNAVTFCLLSDRPVLAWLIARLELLLVFLMTALHASVTLRQMGKLIKFSRDSKRLDHSQILAMQRFYNLLLAGIILIVILPVVQIIETFLYWDYYRDFTYDGAFSGADIYPVHFAAPFVAILICPLFLEQKTAPEENEARSTIYSNPTKHNEKEEELGANRGNATKMVNAAIQNWVESNSNLTASL